MSVAQFMTEYDLPNRPVVITDAIEGWAARKKWTRHYLSKVFEEQDIVAGTHIL